MSDNRERGALPPSWSADHKKMQIDDDNGNVYDCEYIVCDVCSGKGSHVKSSIDSHGISPDEFAADPDFAEDYHKGVYDVTCTCCKGRRVMLVPVLETGKQALQDAWKEELEYRSECSAERRMGA